MELSTNQIIVNVILSSFAYAYILCQLKVYLLKTGVPFNDINSNGQIADIENFSNNRPISGLGVLLVILSLIAYFVYILTKDFNFSDHWLKSLLIIGLVLVPVLFFIILIVIGTFEVYEENRNKGRLKILIKGGVSYFFVFEAISYTYYSADKVIDKKINGTVIKIQHENKYFRDFMYDLLSAHIYALVSYLLASMLLLFWVKADYRLKILIVLISLIFCLTHNFIILS